MTAPDRAASATARGVALLRAAHRVIDAAPYILDDPVIGRLLGPDTEARIRAHAADLDAPRARGLRSHVLLRSRVAEDALADAVRSGARRYVLLGAGLDTFAYRQPAWAHMLAIVEVDHPATQTAKRDALAAAGVAVPPNVHFAAIDFERESLAHGLERSGVRRDVPTVFSWLGVTMYLTRDAVEAVLRTVASFPGGSEIVLTFAQPRDPNDVGGAALPEQAAAVGEPWISYFTPDDMDAMLRAAGFADVHFFSRDEVERRYYAARRDHLAAPKRVSIVRARVCEG